MAQGNMKRLGLATIGFTLALSSFAHAGQAEPNLTDAREFPAVIKSTTLVNVIARDDQSLEVYASKDNRVLTIPADRRDQIASALEAHKNGCEVTIAIEGTSLVKNLIAEPCQKAEVKVAGAPALERIKKAIESGELPTGYTSSGYRPINVSSSAEADRYFRLAYPYQASKYDVNDNCFNRAHFWARSIQIDELWEGRNGGTDKVFIFFTPAYRKAYNHKWWYHVAPMIYVNGNPTVLDPTFMSSATSLSGWLSSFDHHLGGRCKQIGSIAEFKRRSNEVACFYAKGNMYTYVPDDVGRSPGNWRCSDIYNMKASIPAPGARTGHDAGGWDGNTNLYIVPETCGGRPIGRQQ